MMRQQLQVSPRNSSHDNGHTTTSARRGFGASYTGGAGLPTHPSLPQAYLGYAPFRTLGAFSPAFLCRPAFPLAFGPARTDINWYTSRRTQSSPPPHTQTLTSPQPAAVLASAQRTALECSDPPWYQCEGRPPNCISASTSAQPAGKQATHAHAHAGVAHQQRCAPHE